MLFNSIRFLDTSEEKVTDFHMLFALQLTRHLGFFPQGKFSETNLFFDLEEGTFVGKQPRHHYFIEKPLSKSFYEIIFQLT